MNKFLLSASIIAVCSSQVWATRQIVDEEVALTVNQQNVINQLKNIKNTNGILIVDESDIRDRALQRVISGGGGRDAQNDVDTFTREGIIATLNGMAKNSDVDFPNDAQGRKLTRNVKKHNKLSLGFKNKTPLVYPTSENDRTLGDAFLPRNYGDSYDGSSAINKALYQEIDAYVRSVRNISNDQKNLLYRYLEPLFFVVQESVGKLMKGLVNTRGWHMSREDLLTEVMRQAKFHVDMISSANIAGLNSTEVENALTRSLFNQVFAILPDLNKDLGVYYGKTYKLGANIHGDPSLLHPHAGLAYPIFTESHRLAEGWNLPQGHRSSPDLDKQWKRVNHFLLEESSNTQERNNLKILLDPVAHQSLSFLQNLRVDVSNLNLADYGSFMGLSNDEPHDGRFLQSLSPYIVSWNQKEQDLNYLRTWQVDSHVALTSDLWPSRFNDKPKRMALANKLINFLLYHDLKDRVKGSYNLAGQGEIMRRQEVRLTQELEGERNRANQALESEALARTSLREAERNVEQLRQSHAQTQAQNKEERVEQAILMKIAEDNLLEAQKDVRLAQKKVEEERNRADEAEKTAKDLKILVTQAEQERVNLLEENRQAIALLQQTIFDQNQKFSNQVNELKEFNNLHYAQLNETNQALKDQIDQYEQLKSVRLSETARANKKADGLTQKLEEAEGRLKNAEILLSQQEKASRLAKEEADDKYALLQKAKDDELTNLEQLYQAANTKAEQLSEVVTKLTTELDDIRSERAELNGLYDQALFQVEQATARYEKAEDELKELKNVSEYSSVNSSPPKNLLRTEMAKVSKAKERGVSKDISDFLNQRLDQESIKQEKIGLNETVRSIKIDDDPNPNFVFIDMNDQEGLAEGYLNRLDVFGSDQRKEKNRSAGKMQLEHGSPIQTFKSIKDYPVEKSYYQQEGSNGSEHWRYEDSQGWHSKDKSLMEMDDSREERKSDL